MSYGRALLVSVFLITIVSSINIVDARRSPAAFTPESFLDSDQDFGIEVRSDYGGGVGGPFLASSWLPPGTAAKDVATDIYNGVKNAKNAESQIVKTTNALLKEIPEDNKELLKKIGKIDGLEVTYDKTIDKFYYFVKTEGKTVDQIKETIRRVEVVLST